MKNQRFIFTINETNKKLLEQKASMSGLSKSRELNNIISNGSKVNDKSDFHSRILDPIVKNKSNEVCSVEVLEPLLLESSLEHQIYDIEKELKIKPTNELLLKKATLLKHEGSFDNVLNILTNSNFKHLSIYKYLLLSQIAISKGEIPKAEQFLRKAKVQLTIYSTSTWFKNEYIITYAEFLWISKGVIPAVCWIKGKLKELSNSDDYRGKVLLGDLYRDMGDCIQAEKSYKLALKNLKLSHLTYYSRCLRGLGTLAKKRGDRLLAEKLIFDSVRVAKLSQDKVTYSSVLASVGSLHQDNDSYSMAEKIYEKKSKLGKGLNSVREMFYANYDLAMICIAKGEHNKALRKIKQNEQNSIKFKRKFYVDIWEGYIRSLEGSREGISQVETARRIASDNNEQKQVNIADYVLGTVLFYQGNMRNIYYNRLLSSDSVSFQIKSSIQVVLNGSKFIKPV